MIAAGHHVAGCGTDAAQIDGLRRCHGAPHHFQVVDVSSDSTVAKWAAQVLPSWGTPDLLLNNAAVINRNAPLWQVPPEEFSRLIDVNIKGVANVLRHFLPEMVRQAQGIIVNFSSGWGRTTDAGVAPYCASKWAIEGLTQALAQELPAGMAAVALNPGIINTRMLRSCFGEAAGGYPEPEAWARVAVPFLLKLGAADNGQSFTVPL
jgi:NAD(P)-dependent dehydrogenase (short-subunit alcohol dehydrogenase family)